MPYVVCLIVSNWRLNWEAIKLCLNVTALFIIKKTLKLETQDQVFMGADHFCWQSIYSCID